MKFACLLKIRDLNKVISCLNDCQQPTQWYQTSSLLAHPAHHTGHTDHKQLTFAYMGHFKSHTREGHRGTEEDSSLEQTAATGKVPLIYIFVSQQKASEKGWLSWGSMNCQPVATRCYRGGKCQSRLALNLCNRNGKT